METNSTVIHAGMISDPCNSFPKSTNELPADDSGNVQVQDGGGAVADWLTAGDDDSQEVEEPIVLSAKWAGTVVSLQFNRIEFQELKVADLRRLIASQLDIPQTKQKFLGVSIGNRLPSDDDLLSALTYKKPGTFVLVGTPSCGQLPEPSTIQLPFIINDLGSDYVYFSQDAETVRTSVHLERLQRKILSTEFRILQKPRPGKGLLVLDLDYTVFDCKEMGLNIEDLKRPYLNYFLTETYKRFDIVVWSQTKWKWVEMKCTELGLLTSPHYSLCFVLDQTSMFSVTAPGIQREHEVKALEIIWSKFPGIWGPHNTLHVDDLSRNFAMNPRNGIKVSAYRVSKRRSDEELFLLSKYLDICAKRSDVSEQDHSTWKKLAKHLSRNDVKPSNI